MTSELAPVVFPTRVDAWLVAVLAGSGIMSVYAVTMTAREAPAAGAIGAATLLGCAALVMALAVPTRYSVGDQELVIRSGMLRYRIPLSAIRRVYPTRNPLSAPAWSLRRLGIEYDRPGRLRGLALISPADQERFLGVLASRTGLVVEGRELRRPS